MCAFLCVHALMCRRGFYVSYKQQFRTSAGRGGLLKVARLAASPLQTCALNLLKIRISCPASCRRHKRYRKNFGRLCQFAGESWGCSGERVYIKYARHVQSLVQKLPPLRPRDGIFESLKCVIVVSAVLAAEAKFPQRTRFLSTLLTFTSLSDGKETRGLDE